MPTESQEVNEIYAALAVAQGNFPSIPKSKTAVIEKRSGGSYRYNYADLADIMSAIRKPLADAGLAILQFAEVEREHTKVGPGEYTTTERDVMVTRIIHSSGQWIEHVSPLGTVGDTSPQERGSAITYARRYALSALGIVTEEDDDGKAADDAAKNQRGSSRPSPAPKGGANGRTDEAASPAQLKMLVKIEEERAYGDDFAAFVNQYAGREVATFADLTKVEASKVIEAGLKLERKA